MIRKITKNEMENVTGGGPLLEAFAAHCAEHPMLCAKGSCIAACVSICISSILFISEIPTCSDMCEKINKDPNYNIKFKSLRALFSTDCSGVVDC